MEVQYIAVDKLSLMSDTVPRVLLEEECFIGALGETFRQPPFLPIKYKILKLKASACKVFE